MSPDEALFRAASELCETRRWAELSLEDLAEAAGLDPAGVLARFDSPAQLAMALYHQLATELLAEPLPAGSIAERYRVVAHRKLACIGPHRALLTGLLADAVDPAGREARLGPKAAQLHAAEGEFFQRLVDEATDRPSDPAIRERLGPLLYASHLLGIAAWTQDPSRVPGAIDGVADALGMLPMLVFLPGAAGLLDRLGALIGGSAEVRSAGPETRRLSGADPSEAESRE